MAIQERKNESNSSLALEKFHENLGKFRNDLEDSEFFKYFPNSYIDFDRPFINREFSLAVVGKVSSGKSSLINSFVEEDVLPTGILPTTPTVIELLYGTERGSTKCIGSKPPQFIPQTSEETKRMLDNEVIALKKSKSGKYCDQKVHDTIQRVYVHLPNDILRVIFWFLGLMVLLAMVLKVVLSDEERKWEKILKYIHVFIVLSISTTVDFWDYVMSCF